MVYEDDNGVPGTPVVPEQIGNVDVPQPDFEDIASVVAKFLAQPTTPPKRVAQLQPETVFPKRPVDFRDISAAVNAFLGVAFAEEPFGHGPCACPSLVTCGATPCANDAECADGLCVGGFCMDPCRRCTP